MKASIRSVAVGALLTLSLVPAASASGMKHTTVHGRMVAYDAKDRRYYSVIWAKAHGMHDKGGDLLTVVPMSALPKEAKMSRAMHGKM